MEQLLTVAEIATVPAHRPIKTIYVEQFVTLTDRIKD
jgi:hypothetical protein